MTQQTNNKSTITIIEDNENKQIQFHVKHDPPCSGTQDTWPMNVHAANHLLSLLKAETDEAGMKPVFEAQRNAITGEIFVTERKHKPTEEQ